MLFTQPLKRQVIDNLGYGLALEGMRVVDRTVTQTRDVVVRLLPVAGKLTPFDNAGAWAYGA